MSFIQFIRILKRNLLWLLLIPLCLAFSIFYFTRHQKKVYSSETVIYTGIASGYDLDNDNNINFLAVSNEFDNLLSLITSREANQEVALRLLAEHLFLKKHDPAVLSWDAYSSLKKLVPGSLRDRLVKPTVEETANAVTAYMQGSTENLIYKILNTETEFYSIWALKNIKAQRISSSDLIKISYDASDAAICKRTLELMAGTFMQKHTALKLGQTESAVAYFEQQVRDAYARLDSAEQEFLRFSQHNEIINYLEQTKAVSIERENLYTRNHDLEMDQKAARNSLAKMEESIKGRLYQTVHGSEIIKEREQLADIYNKIALGETVSGENSGLQKGLDSLKRRAAALEKNLQASMDRLYEKTNTPNGIPTKDVLDEWLKSSLAYEQSKAKLSVMDKRKKEFEDEYRKYAPVGAMLKKIEREIGVSEREYLDYLHSLSTARLSQQNSKMSSKLTIVDPPFLPIKPNPSKRILLVAVGFAAGFIIVLSVILARALINRTLKEPKRAAATTGLPMLGLFPLLNGQPDFLAKARLRLLQHLLSKINIRDKPVRLGFVSTQSGEGKSTLIDMIYNGLADLNFKVEKADWTRGGTESWSPDCDIVLIEFPALDDMVIGPGLFPQLHHAFLVCRANRVWVRTDKDLLAIFSRTTGMVPSFILNGVETDFAEEFIGEVPRKRFLVRSAARRLVRFEFGSRSAFSGK